MTIEAQQATSVDRTSAPGPIAVFEDADLNAVRDRLEATLRERPGAAIDVVRDYRTALLRLVDRVDDRWRLRWPDSWFIPSDADFRSYWFLEPPSDHRFDVDWAGSVLYPPPTACSGDRATGHVFAYTALAPNNRHDSGFAGVGVHVRPSATLSYLDLSVEADVVAESRIWMLLARPTSNLPTARVRCTAYLCGWDIDPVTGNFELLRPFGARVLIDAADSGQSGTPIKHVHVPLGGNALSTRLQVQAGHTYVIGFHAEVDIDVDVRDAQGQPYQPGPNDDFRVWGDVTASVTRLTAQTTVLIP